MLCYEGCWRHSGSFGVARKCKYSASVIFPGYETDGHGRSCRKVDGRRCLANANRAARESFSQPKD